MVTNAKTVVEIIESYKGEGYIYEFCIKEEMLYCISVDRKYQPDELEIEKSESFEGEPDISGNITSGKTIVYAIAAEDGTKGILINAYGLYSPAEPARILSEIPVRKK